MKPSAFRFAPPAQSISFGYPAGGSLGSRGDRNTWLAGSALKDPVRNTPGSVRPPTRRSPWMGQAVVAANAEQALAADEPQSSRRTQAARLLCPADASV
jgi:hypothetical protein